MIASVVDHIVDQVHDLELQLLLLRHGLDHQLGLGHRRQLGGQFDSVAGFGGGIGSELAPAHGALERFLDPRPGPFQAGLIDIADDDRQPRHGD